MATFSISEAAFSGFALIRRSPKTILAWTAVYVAIAIALLVAFFVIVGVTGLSLIGKDLSQNPAALLAAGPAILGGLLLLLVVSIALAGVVYGAAYRAFLRPADGGFGYFRFGAVELRLVGAYLLMQLVFFVIAFIGAFLSSFIKVLDPGLSPVAGVIGLVQFLLSAWVAVRLSLALAMTFDRNKVQVFESFALTKGQFWPMLGAYALMVVAVIAAFLLFLIVVLVLAAAFGVSQNFSTNPMAALPLMIILGLLYPALAACMMAVMVGPSATIYRSLRQDPAIAETFG